MVKLAGLGRFRGHARLPRYMDKLVERETATRNPLVAAPALAVQFFLIPLAVVGDHGDGVCRLPVAARPTTAAPQDYLGRGSQRRLDRRWPAAYELSRLMADPKVRADRTLGARAREGVRGVKDDDPRVRRYLALAIGRLDPPLPPEAVADLTQGARRSPTAKRASAPSGRSARRAIRRSSPTLQPLYESPRRRASARWWSTRSARCRATRRSSTLRTALAGRRARRALERRGRARAARAATKASPVLRQMLDRQYVEQTVKRDVRQDEDQDPIADVMISGLRAAATLKDDALQALGRRRLSQQDRSMKVRQAALEALKVMG